MATKRYYYEPEDKDAVPVEYEFGGTVCVFESPHQYHKKVEEIYDVGLLIDPRTQLPKRGLDGKELTIKNRRFSWVPDEERNALLKEGKIKGPKNFRELSPSELRYIRQSRFSSILNHLVSEEAVKARHEAEMERIRMDHLAEIERLKAELEAEKMKIAREVEAEKRKGKPRA